MPCVSLVVCLHKERDHLERLLQHAEGCYDDLVVVHDGPDETQVGELVARHGGRFFERPRAFQQEFHWPFAWGQARHDWILRWDADEFPSDGLQQWLRDFRSHPEVPAGVSGYMGVLPLWDGRRARTRRWPHRVILIHRQRVRYFGMADQGPMADGRFETLPLVLHHQPHRKAYGIRYILLRGKLHRWYEIIGAALQGRPTDLPCWRWDSPDWPAKWETLRRHPWRRAMGRLVMSPWGNLREMIQCGEFPNPILLATFPLQHVMMSIYFVRARRRLRRAGTGAGGMRIRPKARPLDWLRYRLFTRPRSVPAPPSSPRKPLAIFKPERLGDFLLAQPAIQRLVDLHGASNTTLIVSPACRSLADRFFPAVEKIEVTLDFSWHGWNWAEARRRTAMLRAVHFEEAVSLTHHRKPALWSAWTSIHARHKTGLIGHPWMVRGFGAEERRHFDRHEPYPGPASPGGDTCLELEAHAAVLNACGAGPVSALELRPLLRRDHTRPPAQRPVLGIAPCASSRLKTLPAALLGAVCRPLAESTPFDVWLIGEPAQRRRLEQLRASLASIIIAGDIRLCCDWSLDQLEAGLMHCTAVLSADTFTAHLATALELPVAVLAAGGQPGVFGPWRHSARQRWFTQPTDCAGCGWRCVHRSALCVELIDPRTVAAFLKDAFPRPATP